jgi:hypothetical protein
MNAEQSLHRMPGHRVWCFHTDGTKCLFNRTGPVLIYERLSAHGVMSVKKWSFNLDRKMIHGLMSGSDY